MSRALLEITGWNRVAGRPFLDETGWQPKGKSPGRHQGAGDRERTLRRRPVRRVASASPTSPSEQQWEESCGARERPEHGVLGVRHGQLALASCKARVTRIVDAPGGRADWLAVVAAAVGPGRERGNAQQQLGPYCPALPGASEGSLAHRLTFSHAALPARARMELDRPGFRRRQTPHGDVKTGTKLEPGRTGLSGPCPVFTAHDRRPGCKVS
ncbi:hypothetical protein ACCO45_003715 [Purpureocillium lilacinum]|uniref:Uncharacterized protein n=1 Tax=Purpureocillium lilacinum TaxID=33203 RepID=A0ACC4E1Y7_PURLI